MNISKKIIAFGFALLIFSGTIFFIPGQHTSVYADDVKIDLQIPVPNPNEPGKSTTQLTLCSGTGADFKCNGIAEYITRLYLWLLGAMAIVTVLIIMVAGLIWMTAAGAKSKITQAQKLISNALLGLVALFASYTILYIINPDLVSFKPLALTPVETITAEVAKNETQANTDAGNYASGEPIASLPNLRFDATEKADVEGGKIKDLTLAMLKSLNSSGIQGIKINVLKSGHNPGSFHNNSDPSMDGRAADIVGSKQTMIEVAKYLFAHRTELQINELYHSNTLDNSIENCSPMDSGYLSRSGLLAAHGNHVHVAVGGCR